MGYAMFIDNFSSGLDDMKRKDQRDERKVMAVLAGLKVKRFSIFEVTANDTIARMMTDIVKRGLIETTGGTYPWTTFRITAKGEALLPATEPKE